MTRARLAAGPRDRVLWMAMVMAVGGVAAAAPPGAATLVGISRSTT